MDPLPSTNPPSPARTQTDLCLVRIVARELESQPALEAVKVDHAAGSLSVATFGDVGTPFADRLARQLADAGAADPDGPGCALLSGASDCADCPAADQPLANSRLTVQHQPGSTTVARVTCPTAPRFWRWRDQPFPRLVPRQVRLPDSEASEQEWKPQIVAALLCGALGLLGAFLGTHPLAPSAFAAAYLAGAWFPAVEVWERLRQRHLDIHFLMLAVAAGAASIGAWGEGAILLFLFSLSGALESYALGRTHREIRSLIRTAPREAVVLGPDASEHLVPVDHLRPGDRLLLKPGDLFPVDAEIALGRTAADESNLTGEAVPVDKQIGDTVLGGTLNLWGSVEAIALRPAESSALQRIIRLIRDSQRLKAPSQRFTDRFGTGYTVGILGLTVLMFLVWWAAGRPPWIGAPDRPSAFYLAMTLLVVASPCALVLSIPSAILAAIAHGARHGILFRGGAAVEKLADIDVVAMDKTGTLTTGELRVDAVESFPPGRETDVTRLAFGVERLSTHPLARAIVRHGKRLGLQPPPVHHLEAVPGEGATARLDDLDLRLGRRDFVLEGSHPDAPEPPPPQPGTSEVWLRHGPLVGRLLLRDDIRPQAREVVADLRAHGLHTVALTGDRHSTADHLQRHLDLDEVRAELRPEQKVAAIAAWSRQGRRVAMVGDGVNDAPALAAAHVGIAMGARGSDAALEQADVVLMHDRLENVRHAHHLSRRARRIIRQNLVISLGTLAVLAVLAIAARLPLSHGVLGHEGSTVLVVLNSLRLLFPARSRSLPR
ncbi:MAG: heavy metal translocating P-type ATPase [Verrucomicrobiae bacterium]|nr:heavy metal translocating P-type ATPase [Verrucomicrobiae bacterium]